MNKQLLILSIWVRIIIYPIDFFAQNPKVGGGEDYGDWIIPNRSTIIVKDKNSLLKHLADAKAGDVIYVHDTATIYLDGYSNIEIKSGVTLASGRGRNGSLGAKIVINNKTNAQYDLFKITGDYVRVTGLRIAGPAKDSEGEQENASGAISITEKQVKYNSLIIDNNEIFGWQLYGIHVYNVKGVKVRYNHIHHCLLKGTMGYGVAVDVGGEATVIGNLFDNNRHDIKSDGYISSEYSFIDNLVIHTGEDQSVDVHACQEREDDLLPNCPFTCEGYYIAGNTFLVENNLLLQNRKWHPTIAVRGVPSKMYILRNQFAKKEHGIRRPIKQTLYGNKPIGCGCYKHIYRDGNSYNVNYPNAWFVSYSGKSSWKFRQFDQFIEINQQINKPVIGDFKGDKRQDFFYSFKGYWYISDNAKEKISEAINASNESFSDLRFGDFTGDGKTDVFAKFKEKWWISDAGLGTWQALNPSQKTQLELIKLLFGDFDGDHLTDVLGTYNGQFHLSKSGKGDWQYLKDSDIEAKNLLVGDFNGDGVDDIFSTFNSKWWYSKGGKEDWQYLKDSNIKVKNLLVGDFDGDGYDDIFYANGDIWQVSWKGHSDWEKINTSSIKKNKILIGDFNGDGKDDVLSYYKEW